MSYDSDYFANSVDWKNKIKEAVTPTMTNTESKLAPEDGEKCELCGVILEFPSNDDPRFIDDTMVRSKCCHYLRKHPAEPAQVESVALTPDRTSAPWFMKNWTRADLVMFTPKIKFLREDGSLGASPSNGTTLWACGDEAYSALKRAARAGLGILAEPRSVEKTR